MSMTEPATPTAPPEYYRDAPRRAHQLRRWQALAALVPRERGRLLDYGCGYGELTHELAKTHDAIGVDVNPARVAFARREYAPIPFSVCRPDGLDFPEASFDIVTSCVVLPFLKEPATHLAECRRVLRPGGRLLLMTASGDDLRSAARRMLARRSSHFHLRRRVVTGLARDAGFAIEGDTYYYDAFEDNLKNLPDILFGLGNLVLSTLRVRRFANYFVLSLRRP
jgi:ubiquinone/menaquinone biosynthesis C-methylase UbiE